MSVWRAAKKGRRILGCSIFLVLSFSDLTGLTGTTGLSVIVRCSSLSDSIFVSAEGRLHHWNGDYVSSWFDRRDRVDIRRHRKPTC